MHLQRIGKVAVAVVGVSCGHGESGKMMIPGKKERCLKAY